jgi:transcriptional regulator with XRE-family HTH domain
MNRLRKLRGDTSQPQFIQRVGLKHYDVPLYSKMENGAVNPVPEDAQKIAEHFNVPLESIWDASDLDYGVIAAMPQNASCDLARRSKDIRSKVTVRKCFRISRSTDEWFTIDLINALGFSSFQSWFDSCVIRAKGQYAVICKSKSARPAANSSDARN